MRSAPRRAIGPARGATRHAGVRGRDDPGASRRAFAGAPSGVAVEANAQRVAVATHGRFLRPDRRWTRYAGGPEQHLRRRRRIAERKRGPGSARSPFPVPRKGLVLPQASPAWNALPAPGSRLGGHRRSEAAPTQRPLPLRGRFRPGGRSCLAAAPARRPRPLKPLTGRSAHTPLLAPRPAPAHRRLPARAAPTHRGSRPGVAPAHRRLPAQGRSHAEAGPLEGHARPGGHSRSKAARLGRYFRAGGSSRSSARPGSRTARHVCRMRASGRRFAVEDVGRRATRRGLRFSPGRRTRRRGSRGTCRSSS
jgi:hypothetical protein